MKDILSIKEGQDYLYNSAMNYEVEDLDCEDKVCFIFFSSNGIYEDSIEKFQRTMIEENRYEWKSIAEVIKKRKKVARIIYVRDIYKQWYIYGINKDICSIDKLLHKLKVLTEGYEVVTIGISSGGYIASIAGAHLKAEKVFCISGQFEIESCISTSEEREGIEPRYLNIVDIIRKNKEVNYYYFCPINCEFDKKNYELIKNIDNIRIFMFDSNIHADTVYPFNFPDMFCADRKKLDKLAQKYIGRIWNKVDFAIKIFTLRGLWDVMIRAMKMKFDLVRIKKLWD